MRNKKAQTIIEYFIIMAVILSAIVATNFINEDGRLIRGLRNYFSQAEQAME